MRDPQATEHREANEADPRSERSRPAKRTKPTREANEAGWSEARRADAEAGEEEAKQSTWKS
jgi:hypothetical protein